MAGMAASSDGDDEDYEAPLESGSGSEGNSDEDSGLLNVEVILPTDLYCIFFNFLIFSLGRKTYYVLGLLECGGKSTAPGGICASYPLKPPPWPLGAS